MLLGFKKQFATKILDGSKKFTIRNPRKVEPKIGETLHMFSGLRTSFTEKISSDHKLTGIQLVDIKIDYRPEPKGYIDIKVDGKVIDYNTALVFVKSDGFDTIAEFATYWVREMGVIDKRTLCWKVDVKDLIMYHWTDLRF